MINSLIDEESREDKVTARIRGVFSDYGPISFSQFLWLFFKQNKDDKSFSFYLGMRGPINAVSQIIFKKMIDSGEIRIESSLYSIESACLGLDPVADTEVVKTTYFNLYILGDEIK